MKLNMREVRRRRRERFVAVVQGQLVTREGDFETGDKFLNVASAILLLTVEQVSPIEFKSEKRRQDGTPRCHRRAVKAVRRAEAGYFRPT